MNNSLLQVFNRLAWFISITLASFVAFLFCDLSSGSYTSAGENFFEWGWVWVIILSLFIKKVFLGASFLESGLSGISNTSSVNTENFYHTENTPINVPMITKDEPQIVASFDDEKEELAPELEDAHQKIENTHIDVPQYTPPPEPDKPSWIVTFFSDRPLAKIGGIILFLGAFFFLSLVWSLIGAVGKILIGLIFGFFLYGIGVWMDKKGHVTESRTLLGVGIAINTLTILSGRWIIGDANGSIFSDTLTLVFLVFNTLFAVVTGLVYNSRTFLVFSFVFAYLIPFLVRSESDSVVLMMLYITTISLGGYLLIWFYSLRNEREEDMKWLLRTTIIGSLILFSLTNLGIDTLSEFILSVVINLVLTSIGIFLTRKTESRDQSLPSLLISSYIILATSIIGIGDGNQAVIYMTFLAIVPLMFYTGMFMIELGVAIFSWILLIPLIVSLILFSIFGTSSIILIVLPIVFLYGISGIFLVSVMGTIFSYIFYFAISIFLIISAISLDFRPMIFTVAERNTVAISAILFFVLSLWSSYKNKLIYLALTALISSSFILVFSLAPGWSMSWVYYVIFLGVAFLYPFVFGRTLQEKMAPFIGYQVVATLFMIGELFYIGNETWFNGQSSSLITLGLVVFVLSAGSLGYTLVLARSISSDNSGEYTRDQKNSITALLGIPLSLFSLAIAVTFSESPLIVSTAWILESSVLAYYSGKNKNRGILIGSLVLLAIGLLRLLPFFDTIHSGQFFALVPIGIIALSLYVSLSFLPKREEESLGNLYDLLHIFGIALVGYAIMEIVPHSSTGWSLLGLNIFLMLSIWFYMRVTSNVISLWVIFLSVFVFFYHLVRVSSLDMSFGPVMIQLSSLALGTYAIWYMKEKHELGKYVFIYAFILVLLITSIYVNQITENVFAVTIYLTLVATIYLLLGINGNQPKYRTIGLYIGTIVLVKILFYDIWVGVDNLIIRVVALMISGGVMIALSQLYGRQVNRPWGEEFSLSNLFSGPNVKKTLGERDALDEEIVSSPDDMPFDETLASDLKKLDISQISSIELHDISGNTILTSRRAGIIRVANYITLHLGKNEFAPSELEAVLMNVLPHIQSALPKNELETMLEKIHNWIKKGGKIVIKKKN